MPKKSDYVRVLYDFVTNESGEIPLKKGDVVRVLSQVDANWLYGKLGVSVGNFPMNFVEEIVVPSIKYGEVLYVGTDDFISDTEGDLSFVKGWCILYPKVSLSKHLVYWLLSVRNNKQFNTMCMCLCRRHHYWI